MNKPQYLTKILLPLLFIASMISLANAEVIYQDQAKLHQIVGQISPANIEKDITKLINFGTRHTLSETESATRGIGATRRWIKSEFEQISTNCG